MRPAPLDPLFAPVTSLPGIGPKLAKAADRLLSTEAGQGARVLDLLFHRPVSLVDRSRHTSLAEASVGEIATVRLRIEHHRAAPPGSRAPYRVIASDASADLTLTFFKPNRAVLERLLPPGSWRWVSGRLDQFDGRLQMVHPDWMVDEAGLARLPAIEPVYPQAEGLTSRLINRAARAALARLPSLPEWLAPEVLNLRALPSFRDALAQLHAPASAADLAADSPVRTRLALDELFAHQLALALVRNHLRRPAGRPVTGDGALIARLLEALPYQLTGAQARAVAAIHADLAAPRRMLRLLQGDVGSGKTVVALLAMARAVEAGRQAALMAPTEILARQHAARLEPLARSAGMRVGVLTGRDKSAGRARTLDGALAGEIDILVGTHALFQDEVRFKDLALAVVDEQHRFGVHQRLALTRKGEAVDLLVLTATPIPRTLVLTYFGDMDVSVLDEKPPGRKPIDTRIVSLDRLGDVYDGIGRALAQGARAYWVCPLVEESEALDVAAASERHRVLAERFGDGVGLLHGRMKPADKDAAMARFAAGAARLLVATTVIEVGVDVPEATIMVIEHAERFGLAQIHQLRGRIGRVAERSTCLLLYKPPLAGAALRRLEILRETEDGFRIAEEDLALRGEGDLLGARQSGMPGFRLAEPEPHATLLRLARDQAALVVATDPTLTGERGPALRTLLHLFDREAAVRLLRAG